MEKFIRGVIYDDVDLDSMTEDMLDLITDPIDEALKCGPGVFYVEEFEKVGINFDQCKEYFKTCDTIAALTRYNFSTGVNHNLIIPKEALSVGLVNELEKVDLGKDLLDVYRDKFYEDNAIASVEPEEFVRGEDEALLQTIDKSLKKIPTGKDGVLFQIPKDSDLGKAITQLLKVS